jgi:hypothetical protein
MIRELTASSGTNFLDQFSTKRRMSLPDASYSMKRWQGLLLVTVVKQLMPP